MKVMKKHILYPDQYVENAWEVDYTALFNQGIRGIILDIDNTLVPYYVPDPDMRTVAGIRRLKESGFSLYIVSNGREERVRRFNQGLGLPYVCHAGKPGAHGFLKAKQHFRLPAEQIAVIGDQIFTDVWGGNKQGMYTILVKQVSKRDEWITAVKRPLEKVVMLFYRRFLKKQEPAE